MFWPRTQTIIAQKTPRLLANPEYAFLISKPTVFDPNNPHYQY
jgi:hypothetical protein